MVLLIDFAVFFPSENVPLRGLTKPCKQCNSPFSPLSLLPSLPPSFYTFSLPSRELLAVSLPVCSPNAPLPQGSREKRSGRSGHSGCSCLPLCGWGRPPKPVSQGGCNTFKLSTFGFLTSSENYRLLSEAPFSASKSSIFVRVKVRILIVHLTATLPC